ncbi:hypothetical protein FDP41_004749 [Naegleria fowleri]|uniref:Uncharacterized protein n=1 Tax=Naegleria fowleri TaxID=5763 RepID=A0A6A5BDW1_NAEFO|nr:uncharacterized protein FDP41_004749 [Naegleria fowleri]KAF0976073.1 hypothetical protein FDP41_004749 [Naegleria fowleri]CAG4712731.1 unnamed protein product [Naegleria fowleri]
MEIQKTPEIEQCLESVKKYLAQYGTSSTEQTLRVQIDQYDQEDFVSFDVLKRTVEFKNERMKDDDRNNNNNSNTNNPKNNHQNKNSSKNNSTNVQKITNSSESSQSSQKTYLHKLIKGTKLRTKSNQRPTPKNPEWVKLTEQLRKKQGDYEYSKMVRNVVNAPAHEREALNSYKGQLSVGLDLIITMATLFIVFYTASQYMFTGENKKQYQILMGLIGLILGLLIDAVLVIVRSKKAEMIDKVQTKHKNIATNSYGIETVPIEVRRRLAMRKAQIEQQEKQQVEQEQKNSQNTQPQPPNTSAAIVDI